MVFHNANSALQSQEGGPASSVGSHSHISPVTQQQQQEEHASLAHTTTTNASFAANSQISFLTQAPIRNKNSTPDNPISDWDSQTAQWKQRFNMKVFNTDFTSNDIRFRGDSTKQSTDKNYTQADIDIMISIVEAWHCDDERSRIAFHRKNKTGFKWANSFTVRSSLLDNEVIKTLLRHTKNGPRIVCAAQDVFDAITVSHCKSVGHFATRKTKENIDETYWNITKSQVTTFIDLCFICNTRNDTVRKKDKGPGVSIKSAGFRDRFQVDLVDFQNDPRSNHNGVTMRWLLVVKDHHTKYVWLRALSRKEAVLVTTELRHLFHEIGFPLIFHSDNGKEFLNRLVYGMIRDADPHILTVTGAPRTPREQGSVENANQHVKGIIAREVRQARLRDPKLDIGWVDVLGPATSAMNNSACSTVKGLTPYRHVFTQDFDFPLLVPSKDRSKIRTAIALDAYCNDSVLASRLVAVGIDLNPGSDEELLEMSLVEQDQLDNASMEEDSLPLSSIIVPTSVLHSDPQNRSSPVPHNVPSSSIPLVLAQQHEYPIDGHGPANAVMNNVSPAAAPTRIKRVHERNALDVVVHDPRTRQLQNGTQPSFGFVLASLTDSLLSKSDHCIIDRPVQYNIGDSQYYDFCWEDGTRFWEIDFLSAFASLQALSTKDPSLAFLDNIPMNHTRNKAFRFSQGYVPKPFKANPSRVVMVAYKSDHYATLVLDVSTQIVTVYDGLLRKKNQAWLQWKDHCKYLIQRVTGSCVSGSECMVSATAIGGIQFHQPNGYDCGPIACITCWYLFNSEEAGHTFHKFKFESLGHDTIRKMVVLEMQSKLSQFQFGMIAKTQYETWDLQDLSLGKPEKEHSPTICTFCAVNLDTADMSGICEIPTCLHKFHWECLIPWQNSISIIEGGVSCPLCLGRVASVDDMRTQDLASRQLARKHHNKLRVSCQEKHSKTLRKQRRDKCDVSPGDIISIKVPPQDQSPCSNLNIVGLVVRVGSTHGLGVIALTEAGILATNITDPAHRKDLFLPSDWYRKVNQDLPISPTLAMYRKQIKGDMFVDTAISRISIRKAHQEAYSTSLTEELVKCRCKRGICTGNCSCIKNNRKCTSICGCKGNCFSAAVHTEKITCCRCTKNNCGKRCGCLRNKKSCHQGCGCKGLCIQSTKVTLCQPCGPQGAVIPNIPIPLHELTSQTLMHKALTQIRRTTVILSQIQSSVGTDSVLEQGRSGSDPDPVDHTLNSGSSMHTGAGSLLPKPPINSKDRTLNSGSSMNTGAGSLLDQPLRNNGSSTGAGSFLPKPPINSKDRTLNSGSSMNTGAGSLLDQPLPDKEGTWNNGSRMVSGAGSLLLLPEVKSSRRGCLCFKGKCKAKLCKCKGMCHTACMCKGLCLHTTLNQESSIEEDHPHTDALLVFGGESFSNIDLATDHRASTPERNGLDIFADSITFSTCSTLTVNESFPKNDGLKSGSCGCKGLCSEICKCKVNSNFCSKLCACKGNCMNVSWRQKMVKLKKCSCRGKCSANRCGCRKRGDICTFRCSCRGSCNV